MAVSQAFDTPLERLGLIPNGMNWRGGWDVTIQYFQNDVVTSPANLASYILNGQTALIGGADPTVNPDWIELSATTTGVIQVNAGSGIAITGTATVPVVENIGILTVAPGNAGIQVTGGSGTAPLNAVISNMGVLAIQNVGLGINVTGTASNPIINNNGVRTVTQGSGITVNNADPNNPVIENAGVTSIVGVGLQVTDPTGPIVTIENTGVLSVVAGNNISVNNADPKNPIVSATGGAPVLSSITFGGYPPSSNSFNVLASGTLSISISPNSLFIGEAFQNGTADPNGTFVFDFSGASFLNGPSNVNVNGGVMDYTFQDSTTSTSYVVPATQGGETPIINLGTNSGGVVSFTLPRLVCPLSNMRGAGLRSITSLLLTNSSQINFIGNTPPNVMFVTYYPNGVQ